jgi:hypothetical protein
MYAPDPRVTFVPASQEQVVSLSASLNKPLIAIPGKASEEVQAYVVGAVNNAGSYTLFVYLHLSESNEAMVYVDHDHLQIEPRDYPQAEAEALAFVESMGFMVQPLHWESLSGEQKATLMRTLPCFTRDLKSTAAQSRGESSQLKLARFFAAF